MIVTIIGARPQFIKAAVVSKELINLGIDEKIIHTGQHYDPKMSDIFWQELKIPQYELNLNVGSGTHGVQTAEMLVKIERYLMLNQQRVKGVLLYGDTNSTVAGALAAAKLGIKIIHVESGLRSFNKAMPEEINRIVTDKLSDILFCPSLHSVEQLRKEGITDNVYNVGDVMYDALLQFSEFSDKAVASSLFNNLGDFYLLTIHRPTNTDDIDNLKVILDATANSAINFLWPVHPRTKKIIEENNIPIPTNIKIVPPFSYFEMLYALRTCVKVVTDSGGVQKEAYWMKKPCITLREETEWIETLRNQWNILTGANTVKIKEAFSAEVNKASWVELYGDGNASKRIVKTIKSILY
jgi:UDP-GlcNAc3NAcA epimerase